MPATPPYGSLNIEPLSTVDRVAEELRRSFFEGELLPGTPLREVALAAALGVSRSTVREALGVLVSEGLAVRVPNRGTQVRRLDPEQVSDVCRARRVIETAGARQWNEASEEQREDVRQAFEAYAELLSVDTSMAPPSTSEFTAAHLELHRSFTALTGSERLVAFADALHSEVRLALAQVDRTRGNAAEQVHSHAHLLALLETGDAETVATELTAHLLEAEKSMIEEVTSRR